MPRLLYLAPAFLLAAHAASADTGDWAGINLPARCAPLRQVPASAKIPVPRIDAKISIANCMAEDALSRLSITPDRTSVQAMNRAVAPSVAILDRVIAEAAPAQQLVAQNAKRDLYEGLVVRARASIPHANIAAETKLDPLVAPWQNEARQAELAMRQLTRAHPELAQGDQVVAPLAADAEG